MSEGSEGGMQGQLFRHLVENIPQRVFYKDLQSRYLAVNSHYAADLGVSPEAMIGQDDYAFHPRALAEHYRRDDGRVMASGKAESFDESYVRDGREITIHTVKTPIRDEAGQVIGVCGIFWDVTEQRGLEARLKESEATLRAIYEHIQEGILVASAESKRFVMANPAMCRMLGYSEAELLQMSPPDLHPPEVLPRLQAMFERMGLGDFALEEELPFRRKDGSLFHADISPTLVDINGRPCFLGVFRDVTERRQAREALARSEETYAHAEAIAHIGSWDWDIATGGLRWSDEIYRIFGQAPQAFAATYQAFLDTVHPEDRQLVIEAVDASLADPSVPCSIVHRLLRPDGEIRIVHERGRVYRDPQGRAVRMIGVVHDITRQKRDEAELVRHREHLEELVRERSAELAEREAQLRRAQEIAHLGHWHVNFSTGELFWSEEIYRIFDRDPETFAPSEERFYQVVHPDDREQVRAAVADAFARRDLYRVDHRIVRPDGSVRWVHEEAVTEVDAEGRGQSLTGTVQDITERKLAETAITAAKEEAERANRAKSEFLSRMSHELRTPLNAILGFGQLLESDPLHPLTLAQEENVREILHAGQHLLEMINEVLDLARIESGRLTVSAEPVDIASLLLECRALLMPLAEQRGIRLLDELSPACASVLADRTRLKQVLLNLLSNAVKYNHEGGSITVTCACQGPRVRLSITDTGPGLTAEQLPHLFKPFERLDADKGGTEGTGIGLALSKRLMELMQGEIGVESQPGLGSSFWIELPACEAPGPSATAGLAGLGQENGMDRQRTILYIEDNPANLRLMERVLSKRNGLRLITAERPGLGVELAVAHRPDLLLLDITMPDMDGYRLLSLLRDRPETRAMPVIGISANAMPKDVERARRAGFADYLTKPLDIPHLLRTIDTVLGVVD